MSFHFTLEVKTIEGQASLFLKDLKGKEYPALAEVNRKKRVNGQREISLSFFYDKINESFLHDIEFGWKLLFKGEWYTITGPTYTLDGDKFNVGVDAVLSFFVDMNGHYLQDEVEDKSRRPSDFFTELFESTGYNYVLVDNLSANTLNYQANQSKTERFLYGIDRFNAEYKIQGKQAYIHGLVGSDKDVILHEDLNIQDVSIEVDASGFHTWAKGFGDKDESKEDADYELEVEYVSPLVEKYGYIEGPAIRDGKYKKEKELKEAVKKQVENSVKISTTVTAIDLTNNGYPEMQFEEGDRVWLYVTDLKQNQQVRVVEIEETFDWEGNIIDAQYTLGNEGIAARYKSQQYNTLSDFRDIQNGKKTLEFNWLPEAIKRASDIINGNLDSHFEYHAGEIIGINKSNPNGYMRFNTDGIGFSRDGGKTYRSAMTYEGIVADAITAGTLRGILIEGVEIRGGILQSLNNNNTFWDLNTGLMEMNNAEFRLGGGADIHFLSPNNRLYYERSDGSITRTSGLGVGNALNNQYPVVWMGTTGTTRSNFSPVDDRYFTGFIANTNRRTVEDGVGNSSIGELFDIRNLPISYNYGFRFDLRGSKKVLRGLSAGSYDYELGESDSPFNALYLRNRMYADSDLEFRNRSNTSKGWRFETAESGNGDAITLRGLNTGSHNYQIGSDRVPSRILNIYLRHNPDVSSDERLKTSFENVDIDFAKRFLEVSPKRYKYKLTNADLSGGIKGSNPYQFGFIAQDIEKVFKDNDNDLRFESLVSTGSDGFKSMQYEQIHALHHRLLQDLYKRVEELENVE